MQNTRSSVSLIYVSDIYLLILSLYFTCLRHLINLNYWFVSKWGKELQPVCLVVREMSTRCQYMWVLEFILILTGGRWRWLASTRRREMHLWRTQHLSYLNVVIFLASRSAYICVVLNSVEDRISLTGAQPTLSVDGQ